MHGDVIKTVKAKPGAETVELIHELQPQTSLWLAVRAFGSEMGVAHSAPVYIAVDGHTRCWKKEGVPEMVARMYAHLPERMHWAAGRSVLAHLEHMVETGRVAADGPITTEARYTLA